MPRLQPCLLLPSSLKPVRACSSLPCVQLCSVLHEHAFEQLDRQAMHNDTLVGQLSRELENGRLLRLACRLAMVCERSTEEDLEAQWSETGKQPTLL